MYYLKFGNLSLVFSVFIKQSILLPFAKYHIFQIWINSEECEQFENMQERRKKKIREVCKKYNLATGIVNMNQLNLNVDVKEKFIFCKNVKVSTLIPFWEEYFRG